ncbi:MAG: transporter [Verrucomicrobia bacterium]|nr:transporter [Verrucomicrobiota bacterium]
MNRSTFLLPTLAFSAALHPVSLAEDTSKKSSPDKTAYTLFNPTPDDQLREMSTDRPDQTESAFTVDAGRFQVEMDLFTFSRDHDDEAGADTVAEDWSAVTLNLKAGLLHNLDVQLMLAPYSHSRTHDRTTGDRTKADGFGDLTTRLKYNVWGNDDESTTALALMPFVKIPTAKRALGNNAVEGGLIVPLSVSLPWGWSMGLMTEFDILRDAADSDYHVDFINSITFSHDIAGKLGGYVEFFTVTSTENGVPWQGQFDVGLTYGLTDDVQLDAGINIGVTDSAPDWQPFVGLSFRF